MTIPEAFGPRVSRRALIQAGIGGAALLGLAACSPSGSRGAAGGIGGEMQFASWQWDEPGFMDYWKQTTTAFASANAGVSVKPIATPYTSYFDNVLVQMRSGNTPDIYMGSVANLPEYISLEALEPLDDLLAECKPENFYPTQKNYCKVDGTTYGMLVLNTGDALWYNKRLFDEAGIEPPKSLDEVLPAAKAIARGSDRFGIALTDVEDNLLVNDTQSILFGMGEGLGWVDDEGRPSLTGDAVKETISWYKSVLESGAAVRGLSKVAYRELMQSGRVGMTIDGSFFHNAAVQANPEAKEFLASAPVPTPTQATALIDNILMIPKAAKNKETAKAYIKSLYTEKSQQDYVRRTSSPAGWANTAPSDFQEENPWFTVFSEIAAKTKNPTPATFADKGSEYSQVLLKMLSSYYYGGVSLGDATSTGQAALEELAKRS